MQPQGKLKSSRSFPKINLSHKAS